MPDLRNEKAAMLRVLLKIVVVMAAASLAAILAITIFQFSTAYNKYGALELDANNATFTQLDEPAENQEIAIVKTNKGEFRIALYREFAPNTVENFVNNAKSGYYDGIPVLSGVTDRYFICGSEESDGVALDPEISENLWTFKGSVCAVTEDYDSSAVGNRLLFVNSIEFSDDILSELGNIATKYGGKDLIQQYIDNGGILNFAGKYTVFGQVYEGMDVFEEISGVPNTEDTNTVFSEDVIIESIEIGTYTKNK